MKRITQAFALAFGLSALAPVMMADVVYYKDASKEDVADVIVTVDAMRRLEWEAKDRSGSKDNAEPYDISFYRLGRRDKAQTYEDKINNVLKRDETGAALIERTVDEAINLAEDPSEKNTTLKNYPKIPGVVMRLRLKKLMAKVTLNRDDAEDAFKAYMEANAKYAALVEKENRSFAAMGSTVAKGPAKGRRYVALHATTAEAYTLFGDYLRNKGELKRAHAEGYQLAADLGDQLRKATQREDFLRAYSIPTLERSAAMFETADEPDWKAAYGIHKQIESFSAALDNKVRLNRARMDQARCLVETGDLRGAALTYRNETDKYERARDKGKSGPPKGDWLSAESAALYAAAYNGLGLVAMKKGDYFDAARNYAVSLSTFSADDEARGDALIGCAMANVKMAEKNKGKLEFYKEAVEGYLSELALVLSHTRAAARAGEVRAALDLIVNPDKGKPEKDSEKEPEKDSEKDSEKEPEKDSD